MLGQPIVDHDGAVSFGLGARVVFLGSLPLRVRITRSRVRSDTPRTMAASLQSSSVTAPVRPSSNASAAATFSCARRAWPSSASDSSPRNTAGRASSISARAVSHACMTGGQVTPPSGVQSGSGHCSGSAGSLVRRAGIIGWQPEEALRRPGGMVVEQGARIGWLDAGDQTQPVPCRGMLGRFRRHEAKPRGSPTHAFQLGAERRGLPGLEGGRGLISAAEMITAVVCCSSSSSFFSHPIEEVADALTATRPDGRMCGRSIASSDAASAVPLPPPLTLTTRGRG